MPLATGLFTSIRPATVLVDAHVHVHECFEGERLLNAAATNFAQAASRLHAEGDVYGALMLTESVGVDYFGALAEGKVDTGSWQISPTDETVSLLATRYGMLAVLVIAGRQIVTAERIEVLALGTRAQIPDGMPIADTIDAVRACHALAVLPWGFGKWWGKRGRATDAYLASVPRGTVCLGDNGGRPVGLPAPKQFARAARRKIRILPGSDPLPHPAEVERIGSYGFALHLGLDLKRPAAAIRAHLEALEQPVLIGRLQRPERFVRNQLWLRIRRSPSGQARAQDDTATPAVGRATAKALGAGANAPATTVPAEAARGPILMIAPQAFFRVTGTPINVLMMCRALTESGFAVHLLTVPHGEDVDLPGLTIHRVARLPGCDRLPVGFSAAKLAYNAILMVAFLRLLRRRRFVAVHAIEEAAFWAVPLAHIRGLPGIMDLDSDLCRQLRDHGSRFGRMLAVPADWLRRFALRRATGALTVCRNLSEIVRADNAAVPTFEIRDIPIESAGRQPDPERMAALRARHGLGGRRLVVYTGNFDRRQGLPELITAITAVRKRYPKCLLLVVGGEPEQIEALQARIEASGFADAVRLIGEQPPDTMPEYMGLAEVLVSPRLEPYTTPLKIFSYMASGRPIVATDLPTHTEILDAEAAILVPPTSEGLAAGILRALDDPVGVAALGRRARLIVEQRHTFAGFRQRLAAFYAAVLDPTDTPTHPRREAERPAHV